MCARIVWSILHIWKNFLNSSFIFSIKIHSHVTRISDNINLTNWHEDIIERHKETLMAIIYPWRLSFWALCCVTGLSDVRCQRIKRQQMWHWQSDVTLWMWHIMLCGLLGRYQCFGGICIEGCLVWRWKQPAPPVQWYQFTKLHNTIPQKTCNVCPWASVAV